jgi:hypothetical protein
MKRFFILALGALAWASTASAQPAMDGNASAGDAYGTALSVQNTNTQFGDAILGDPINGGGGSEIDQVFGKISNGRLYVTVTGNLEPNFNKLEVFIDSAKPGGVNQIVGNALPSGVDAFCCGGFGTADGALQRMNGLTFDTGFNANYLLTFSNGYETVNPGTPNEAGFWAITAHYANLSNGTNGAVVSAGMQLAYGGKPNVLRFPGDYNKNGQVDAADYVLWRKTQGQAVAKGAGADANGSQVVDVPDYDIWRTRYSDGTTLGDFPFKPTDLTMGVSQALVGPALPGLAQGQLIDRNYALSSGGCSDDTGAGCLARELGFALDVNPNEVGTNQSNHRNMNNSIGLQMAFDNSNAAGVTGAGPYTTPTTGNPQAVTTGLEFSIPLAQIGNPTGPVKLAVFVNGNGHNYASNQFAGDGVLDANLGGNGFGGFTGDLSGDNMNDFTGNQYVTVPGPGSGAGVSTSGVPEPASALLALIAAVGFCSLSRRP